MSDAIRPNYQPRQRRQITWAIMYQGKQVDTFTATDAQGGNHPNAQRAFAAWCSEGDKNPLAYTTMIIKM